MDSLETVWLKNHQHLYQKIQTLQEAFQNEQESTRCDIQVLKTDLENELGEQGHSPAGCLFPGGKSCSTGELSWVIAHHSFSKQMEKYNPYVGNSFFDQEYSKQKPEETLWQ